MNRVRGHSPRVRPPVDGFTLVELLVAIGLTAVATTVVFTVFISTQGMYYDTRTMTANQSESRVVLGMLSQEIRSAGSDALNRGVQRIAFAADDTLRIQSDLNGDGVLNSVDEPAEDVTYYYDPADETLVRRTGAGDIPMMTDVAAFRFRYLAADGTSLGPLPLEGDLRRRVRAVGIELDFRLAGDAVRRWETTVAIRNERLSP
jgi:prepilin-type N-terminal cleavage/methylation domain-containing protein